MLPALLELVFGCGHVFGFPVTDPESHRTYQVCVYCGKEYEYDWERMTRVRRVPRKPETSANTAHRTAAH